MSAVLAPAKSPTLTEADIEALTGLKRVRWQKFVLAYVMSGSMTVASDVAGFGAQRGRKVSKRPAVAEAIRVVRAELARRATYDLDKLVADLDAAADFAVATENATALVRARELKGKALGLLMDRVDMRLQLVPFRIEINTALEALPPIEGKAVEVPT
jgi:hypothetical protein